jgi:hypothetical protein
MPVRARRAKAEVAFGPKIRVITRDKEAGEKRENWIIGNARQSDRADIEFGFSM